jgi:baculoviral IAP repeat-containing protein 6
MIAECPDNGYKFNVAYHFESTVRAAGERCHPARMKRLAQEAVTLSTSLPLSYSSSVFVRTDQDRLDVMKVIEAKAYSYTRSHETEKCDCKSSILQ